MSAQGNLLPNGKQQFLDGNGAPLSGGSVAFYVPGTLTPKDTWQDPSLTILNTNPVGLDASGEAIIYGAGAYRQIVSDSRGNVIWDELTSQSPGPFPSWGGLATGTGNAQACAASSFTLTDGCQIGYRVANANTGATTLAVGTFPAKPCYVDTSAGPVAFSGGELEPQNIVIFTYDVSLDAFHLATQSYVNLALSVLDSEFEIENVSDHTKLLKFSLGNLPTATTRTVSGPNGSGTMLVAGASLGGVLSKSTNTVLALLPRLGNQIAFPSGALAAIPGAGITSDITSCSLNGVAAQALSAGTLYYAYLWNNGTSYIIDFSTTGHATDSGSGIEIKSGDAARVLLGMVYPQSGPVLSDSPAARLVASWFNRQPKQLLGAFTADRTTTSTSLTELNTEIRTLFLSWADALLASYSGTASNSGANLNNGGISLDGASTAGNFYGNNIIVGAGSTYGNMSVSGAFVPTEGEHYLTYLGAVGAGTGTWQHNTTNQEGTGQISGSVVI